MKLALKGYIISHKNIGLKKEGKQLKFFTQKIKILTDFNN
jgi:hypothetical protein